MSNSFSAKNCNNHREYHYYLPTFVLQKDVKREGYRISPELFEKVQSICKEFKGTKKYHNYTKKDGQQDVKRHIYAVNCFQTVVEEDIEYAKLVFVGQSFLYNQIRKMVGVVVKMCREGLDLDFMRKTFEEGEVNIPLAPGEGLYLYKIDYSKYNKHRRQKKNDIDLEPKDEEKMGEFTKRLFARIASEEKEKKVFGHWIEIMEKYSE